jgi:hypothetical protein
MIEEQPNSLLFCHYLVRAEDRVVCIVCHVHHVVMMVKTVLPRREETHKGTCMRGIGAVWTIISGTPSSLPYRECEHPLYAQL